MKGAQTATNTKHRERSMAEEIPASAGDNGADAAPATPYNHSHTQSHHSLTLCTYVYIYYYLPKENYNALLLAPKHYMLMLNCLSSQCILYLVDTEVECN